MRYHIPDLPPAIDHAALVRFIEDAGLDPEDVKGLAIDMAKVTVTVKVYDEDGNAAVNMREYKVITKDVDIPIARSGT